MHIAIAGGTSPTLGFSIVSALLATDGRYTPVILSRETTISKKQSLAQNEVEVRYVDYHSQTSLVTALKGIDTVISVLLIPGPEWVTVQLNLLHAAEAAGCRRFAPSEFALTSSAHSMVDVLDAKNKVWEVVQTSVNQHRIDAARFPCGMFMNYLGIGCPDSGRRKDALAGFQEGPFLVHFENPESPWIEVPLRSDQTFPRLTMTDIHDIGRFIVAALDITEPWAGRELGMVGDTLSFGDLISICQKYVERPIEIRPLTESALQTKLLTIPQSEIIARMECQLAIVCARDMSVVPPTLNELSSVQPMTVAEYMRRYWGPERYQS
ncbi:hypothetical protein EN45_056420 [Penicillium chrysogenum]|jgi:hypothetical protein|uniref:Pc20g05780 protein n=2 Tax=Penicillium chrysogenum species complex TaxID=254878 RepID=B6HFG0_PENRW|nr:uncharacterized protein N7525_008993 [Penicillium rubens]KAJ5047900.1 hypothetical protein NUH16_006397 [Penicillium rubens]KAJ5830740.1 hypothetical protein N7525_008993 [Penicillium rubens]KZN87086.1 hypothetical protein EN45_056420 [Penicillium chrysogenum]CAP85907.1 Pc20g05780 [Penicillium rubens Wisconsin 54-1255]